MGAFDTQPQWYRSNNPNVVYPPNISDDQWNPNTPRTPNGMLYEDRSVRLAEVTDGASNTVMIGESLFGYWADEYSCCVRVWHDPEHPDLWDSFWSYTPEPNYPWLKFTYVDIWPNTPKVVFQFFGFGSSHQGELVCFALVDGSVKTISKRISTRVFEALSTRNGAMRDYVSGINVENVTTEW